MTDYVRTECTEMEELYAQMRSAGHTKTKSAQKAYPSNKNPRQIGYEAELRPCVIQRIKELKEERAESSGLDVHEQIRRYNEIYLDAMANGKEVTAMKALERIDAIGGFDAPSRSISITGTVEDALKGIKGDIGADIAKFAGVLGKHQDTHSIIDIEAKELNYNYSTDLDDEGVSKAIIGGKIAEAPKETVPLELELEEGA